ncbi:MAG: hypothetical protein IJI68_00075 [Eggerthellaceae bacterium]|nr:hypothetical protein [Eggerthellaceae bacterium]
MSRKRTGGIGREGSRPSRGKGVRKLSATCSRDVDKSENRRPSSSPSRARENTPTYPTSVSKDTSNSTVRLTGAPARTHAKGERRGGNPSYRSWRRKKFGGDFDPIAVAVDEAVRAFSRKDPERDRAVWLSVANQIGEGAFRAKMRQMQAQIEQSREACAPIQNKAAYFQGLLNRYTEHHTDSTKGASCTQ